MAPTQTSGLQSRCDLLRSLHRSPLLLPNAWDVATARAVVAAGFPVVATSSGAVVPLRGARSANAAAPMRVKGHQPGGHRFGLELPTHAGERENLKCSGAGADGVRVDERDDHNDQCPRA